MGSTPPHSQPRGFPEVWPGLGVSPEDTCVLPASLDSVRRAPAGVLAATCPHLAQGLGRNERACRLCCVKNTMGGGEARFPFTEAAEQRRSSPGSPRLMTASRRAHEQAPRPRLRGKYAASPKAWVPSPDAGGSQAPYLPLASSPSSSPSSRAAPPRPLPPVSGSPALSELSSALLHAGPQPGHAPALPPSHTASAAFLC